MSVIHKLLLKSENLSAWVICIFDLMTSLRNDVAHQRNLTGARQNLLNQDLLKFHSTLGKFVPCRIKSQVSSLISKKKLQTQLRTHDSDKLARDQTMNRNREESNKYFPLFISIVQITNVN